MIFVTVGGQLPFDRLIDAVNKFALGIEEPVLAQTLTHRQWSHIETVHSLSPDAFGARCHEARVIVGHAGIGTYLTARELGKPLVIVPRRALLREHRSDHQMDTAEALEGQPGVSVAWEIDDLGSALAQDLAPVSAACPTYQGLLSAVATAVA